MKDLEGKVALVTGGATSIGAAVTRALHGAGAAVAIADIAVEAGAQLAGELGERCAFMRVDVADEGQIESGIAAAVDRFGGLDIVVNVAARYLDEGVDSDSTTWIESLKVNLVAAALTARHARPRMQARGGGAIVNFASTSGHVAQAGRWTYPAAKAALLQLTRSQAMDLAPDGIRVNAVTPGKTWSTPIARKFKGERAAADAAEGKYHLLGRIGEAEEVARAVVFLCSADAGFITGTELVVDGGFLAMGPEAVRPRVRTS